ncbi:MAG: Sec-independent protein translocase subunit TatA [Pseudonocardiaceae bacterium]
MIPTGWELVLLVAVLFLLFGASKLPTAARSIGQSMRIFKAETKRLRSDDEEAVPGSQQTASQQPPQQPPQQVLPPPSGPQVATPSEQAQRNNDTSR